MCAGAYAPGNHVRRPVCADPHVRHYTMRRARLLMRQRFLVLRRECARPNVSRKTKVLNHHRTN